MFLSQALPDITSQSTSKVELPLSWVGMDDISVPLTLKNQSVAQTLAAKASVYVSLDDASAKGIHMSRLHQILNRLAELELSKENLNLLLEDLIASQQKISESAKISLSFDMVLKKPALLSDEFGYQSYPVKIHAESIKGTVEYSFELAIPYSSTCPCSASLSRQLYSQAIDNIFSEQSIDKQQLLEWVISEAGSIATPHSQRSFAYIDMNIGNSDWPDLEAFILQIEDRIATPVQTAVKRQDEQEFARLNAQNLMFCEDAARKIKQELLAQDFIKAYKIKVDHQESLHAHNAVALDFSHNA